MHSKLKREWTLYAHSKMLARGVVYREWNLQCLWRDDIGWTAQQMSGLHVLFETFPKATRLEIEPLTDYFDEPYAHDTELETIVIKENPDER